MRKMKVRNFFLISSIVLICGILLSINLFPVSTIGLNEEQKRYLLQEGSINYNLGKTLITISKFFFIISFVKLGLTIFFYFKRKNIP